MFAHPSWAIEERTLEEWLRHQETLSQLKMRKNISPEDGALGSVIASPSKTDPDYYYHWVRDAALTMNVLVNDIIDSKTPIKHPDFKLILDYIDFTQTIQNSFALTGLGEPKFYVDGRSFQGPWGRPQNDSPALRAYSLARLALKLIKSGNKNFVEQKLYRRSLPADTVIKKDLEYVAHHWHEPSFDLWEEVRGQHFYTLMAARSALVEGEILAQEMSDEGAAQFYHLERLKIEQNLEGFLNQDFILTTINRVEGLDYKKSNLDVATLLAVLHAENDSYISHTHPLVQSTIEKLQDGFHSLYRINQQKLPAELFGRYPEDKYYDGNPWILCTLAVAEIYYLKAYSLNDFSFFKKADLFLKRLQYHSREDGGLAEQLHKDTGYQLGAVDLTWSHASFLTTLKARKRAQLKLKI
jgi:glucoamylase